MTGSIGSVIVGSVGSVTDAEAGDVASGLSSMRFATPVAPFIFELSELTWNVVDASISTV